MPDIVPITLADANAFVAAHCRHHAPVVGHQFSIAVADDSALWGDDDRPTICGVAIVGRLVAIALSAATGGEPC